MTEPPVIPPVPLEGFEAGSPERSLKLRALCLVLARAKLGRYGPRGVQDAEDVAQDAFLRAIGAANAPPLEAPEFVPWLAGHLGNAIQRRVRRYLVGRSDGAEDLMAELEDGHQPSPALLAEHRERDELVQSLLQGLPVRERNSLSERYLRQKTPAAIALQNGTTRTAEESCIQRGRERLRDRFLRVYGAD
jgi:RNA polymerase sigma factor (sigma-70 family)